MNVIQKTEAGNPLVQLAAAGQSPWLDFIQRSFVAEGKLKALVENDALRGVTSNPSIFEKAMGHGTEYDSEIKPLAESGSADVSEVYETAAISDIRAAADVLKPVWDATKGLDGYVSLEVSPYLALTTEPTIVEARKLWEKVDRRNLMVKVPGTDAGVPAIRQLIADGLNINVTLLFSLDAYKKVLEAYIAGLEERAGNGEDISHIASVASFFVSRIDGKIDGAIDKRSGRRTMPTSEALEIGARQGRDRQCQDGVSALSWTSRNPIAGSALEAKGANPQRLLWASTGTKDKAYSDVLYVEELIGPETVNTMPPVDHGRVSRSWPSVSGVADRRHRGCEEGSGRGRSAGTGSRRASRRRLVDEGVASFADAFDALLGAVAAKRVTLVGDKLPAMKLSLPERPQDRGRCGARGLAQARQDPEALATRCIALDRQGRGEMARLARHRR